MPITFACSCGKTLKVADEHAGRRVKCPACNSVTNVPAPEPMFEVVEEAEQLALAPTPAKGRPVAKPAPRDDDDDDDDRRGYGVAKSGRDEDEDDEPRGKKKPDFRKGSGRTDDEDDEEDEDRPKRKKKRKKRPPERQESGRSFEGNVVHGGVAIGILAMIGAVVWFVIGLANDIIFFYPPILFIIGLVAFFKGLTGEE